MLTFLIPRQPVSKLSIWRSRKRGQHAKGEANARGEGLEILLVVLFIVRLREVILDLAHPKYKSVSDYGR